MYYFPSEIPHVRSFTTPCLSMFLLRDAKSLSPESWLVFHLLQTNQISGITLSRIFYELTCNFQVAAVSAFSQTLRRYTSLNHLAQAARAVLQNPQQINQMWADLNKVDFTNVQEQSSWVCQCDENLITKLEQDFKNTLAQQVRN